MVPSLLGALVVLLALGGVLFVVNRWHRTVLARLETNRQVFARIDRRVEALTRELDGTRALVAGIPTETLGIDEVERVVRAGTDDGVRRTRKVVATDLMRTYRQLEALHGLHTIIDVAHPLPASRDWAASPDLLLYLMNLVERHRPSLIVECGSGLSTLWFGLALRHFGIAGRVVALEHSPVFAEQTRETAAQHGLTEYVEIRDAELEPYEIAGEEFRWYATKGWEDLDGLDLLFVDGPPADTNRLARYPALPLLLKTLAPQGIVVLDDMSRTDEQQTLERWEQERPEFAVERVRLEKHAAMLCRLP